MDPPHRLLQSPSQVSDHRERGNKITFQFPKRIEATDDFLRWEHDPWDEDVQEESHSIFNIGYSPMQRLPEHRLLGSPRLDKLAFPVLPSTTRTDPSTTISSNSNMQPSLCHLFDIKLSVEPNCQLNEDASRIEEAPSRLSCRPSFAWEFDDFYRQPDNKVCRVTLSDSEPTPKPLDNDDQKFRDFENNIKSKGLKLLSIIVFEIVTQKSRTTYKEVADLILRDTLQFPELKVDRKTELSREEQNIKRRVYDVLNVLISARAFLKEGKLVRRNNIDPVILARNKRADLNSVYSKLVWLSEESQDCSDCKVSCFGIHSSQTSRDTCNHR